MKMHAIALDDEPPALKVLEHFCSDLEKLSLERVFTGPGEAMKYLRRYPVDLLFLDIEMPALSGVDFCKMVPPQCMVIFVTAHSQYAVDGFDLNAVDYLLKPYTQERFMQAIQKAHDYYLFLKQSGQKQQQYLFIRADYQLQKIALGDIVCIEGLDDYVKICLQDQRTVVSRITMKAMEEKLPLHSFVRIHRSFILPLSRIEGIRNKVISAAGREFPVGSSYEAQVMRIFSGEK